MIIKDEKMSAKKSPQITVKQQQQQRNTLLNYFSRTPQLSQQSSAKLLKSSNADNELIVDSETPKTSRKLDRSESDDDFHTPLKNSLTLRKISVNSDRINSSLNKFNLYDLVWAKMDG